MQSNESISSSQDSRFSGISDASSIISSMNSRIVYKGFVVPAGYSYKPNYVNGKLEGIVYVYDKRKLIFAKLCFHQDSLDGVSEFYQNGVLHELRTYKNHTAEGWGSLIENGEETVWFVYKRGKRAVAFAKLDDTSFRKEIEVPSGSLLSIAQYNEKRELHGICYKFNDSKIERISEYENGKEMHVLKCFENDEMKEFSDSHLIYQGQYACLSEVEYVREGSGKEFLNDKLIYSGTWSHNERSGEGCSYSNNRILYQGTWREDVPNGQGKLFDEHGKVIEGNWSGGVLSLDKGDYIYPSQKEGEYNNESSPRPASDQPENKSIDFIPPGSPKKSSRKKSLFFIIIAICVLFLIGGIILVVQLSNKDKVVIVHNKKEFDKLKDSVRFIQFPSDSCNEEEFTDLDFSRFSDLESVIVESRSLRHVRKVHFTDLSSLETIQISDNAFVLQDSLSVLSEPLNGNKEVILRNCPVLNHVEIGVNSFSDYNVFSVESNTMIL